MGRRGPPPTPTRVLELRGSKRARGRTNEPLPTPVVRPPSPPPYLDVTGKNVWRRVARELLVLGVLTKVDTEMLAGFCAAYARAVAAEKVIKVKGLTMLTLQGEIARPEIAIARTSWALVRQLGGELGLSPSSRTRVRPAEKKSSTSTNRFSALGGGTRQA